MTTGTTGCSLCPHKQNVLVTVNVMGSAELPHTQNMNMFLKGLMSYARGGDGDMSAHLRSERLGLVHVRYPAGRNAAGRRWLLRLKSGVLGAPD